MKKEYGFPTVPFFYTSDAAKMVGVDRTTVWRWVGKIIPEEKDTRGRIIISLPNVNVLREKYDLSPLTREDADYYWEYGRLPHNKSVR